MLINYSPCKKQSAISRGGVGRFINCLPHDSATAVISSIFPIVHSKMKITCHPSGSLWADVILSPCRFRLTFFLPELRIPPSPFIPCKNYHSLLLSTHTQTVLYRPPKKTIQNLNPRAYSIFQTSIPCLVSFPQLRDIHWLRLGLIM